MANIVIVNSHVVEEGIMTNIIRVNSQMLKGTLSDITIVNKYYFQKITATYLAKPDQCYLTAGEEMNWQDVDSDAEKVSFCFQVPDWYQ